MLSSQRRQGGIGTFAAIGSFVGLGVVFLLLFLMTSTKPAIKDNPQTKTDGTAASATTEPPFIRIPENSEIFTNNQYKFMFAYPDSFGKLTPKALTSGAATDQIVFGAESALAVQKPVGAGTAFLNGTLAIYVYKKTDFKMVTNSAGVTIAPTKTGNDITWKVVSRGSAGQDVSIGDSYPVKTIKSQTGITVFELPLRSSSSALLARYTFEVGDFYAIVALPFVNKPSNLALTDSDVAAYNIIGTNIAKTVRVQATPTAGDASGDSKATNGNDTTKSTQSGSN